MFLTNWSSARLAGSLFRNRRRPRRRCSARTRRSAAIAAIERLEDRTLLSAITVDSDLDVVNPDDGVTTLREAILQANVTAGADTIVFSQLFQTAPRTIVLTGGQLDVDDDLSIFGPGSDLLTISGNQASRIFEIEEEIFVEVNSLTLTGGKVTSDENGGAIRSDGNLLLRNLVIRDNAADQLGGGIFNTGDLRITGSVIEDNRAGGGAGIANDRGDIAVNSSSFSGNTAVVGDGTEGRGGGILNFGGEVEIFQSAFVANLGQEGGAIFNDSTPGGLGNGNMEIVHSTFTNNSAVDGGAINNRDQLFVFQSEFIGNSADDDGGAVDSGGFLLVEQSTFTGNIAGSESFVLNQGGAISLFGAQATIVNSTISGNTAHDQGGGIAAIDGTQLNVHNSTIAGNIVTDGVGFQPGGGGGILVDQSSGSPAAATLKNTIVAGNSSASGGPDIKGSVTANHSLIQSTADTTITGTGNITGQDPLLGPLADNGGRTRTRALLEGSPAIGAGRNELALQTDQRGFLRNFKGSDNGVGIVDIGADEQGAQPAALQVTSFADEFELPIPADGTLSLREAIFQANNIRGDVTINLGAGTYTLTRQGSDEDDAQTGDLDVDNPFGTVRIVGVAQGQTTIAAAGRFRMVNLQIIVDEQGLGDRVFEVHEGSALRLDGVTISGGHSDSGGGVANRGSLVVVDSTISGNAGDFGGGISSSFASGDLTLTGSTISNNLAGNAGGGIVGDGSISITNSTIAGNTAKVSGGGVHLVSGTATLTGSTISGNSAGAGGGMLTGIESGRLILTNSTISGNSTIEGGSGPGFGNGGGLDLGGPATITNSTITGNVGFSGGVHVDPEAIVSLRNTIIAGNSAVAGSFGHHDVSGAFASGGFNLIGNTTGGSGFAGSDQLNINPQLGPLGDNGGPTLTHALLAGSPAIDAGDPEFDPNAFGPPLLLDQRGEGFDRVVNGRIDIGGFEMQTEMQSPDVSGTYTINGGRARIERTGDTLEFVNEHGNRAAGRFLNPGRVIADGWGGLEGTIDGHRIEWANGTQWNRSLAGNWEFNGQSARIEQQGTQLVFINEHGHRSNGTFNAIDEIVAQDWGNLTARLSADRIEWANGTRWDRSTVSVPDLSGRWAIGSLRTQIQQTGDSLRFINEHGNSAAGRILSPSEVIADGWEGLTGTINGHQIQWDNGTVWARSLAGNWEFNGQTPQIEQQGTQLVFINEHGNRSNGTFADVDEVVAQDWGNLMGRLSANRIVWANGTAWTGESGLEIALSANSAVPGQTLLITGQGFDPNANTEILFIDEDGVEVSLFARDVSASSVEVMVPTYVDTETFGISSGTVSVSVVQESAFGRIHSNRVDGFHIQALPEYGVRPGFVTVANTNHAIDLVESARNNLQGIQDAASDVVNLQPLLDQLANLQQRFERLRDLIQPIFEGTVERVALGRLDGLDVFLDRDSLDILDREFLALVLKSEPALFSSGAGTSSAPAERSGQTMQTATSPEGDAAQRLAGFYGGVVHEIRPFASNLRDGANSAVSKTGLAAIAAGANVGQTLAAGSLLGAQVTGVTTWVPAAIAGVIESAGKAMLEGSQPTVDAARGILEDSTWELLEDEAKGLAAGRFFGEGAGELIAELLPSVSDLKDLAIAAGRNLSDNFEHIRDSLFPPPEAPVVLQPSTPTTDTTPTITWFSVAGAERYEVVIRSTLRGTEVVQETTTSTSFTPSSPLEAGSGYHVVVRAINASGREGNWSESRFFSIEGDVEFAGSFNGSGVFQNTAGLMPRFNVTFSGTITMTLPSSGGGTAEVSGSWDSQPLDSNGTPSSGSFDFTAAVQGTNSLSFAEGESPRMSFSGNRNDLTVLGTVTFTFLRTTGNAQMTVTLNRT